VARGGRVGGGSRVGGVGAKEPKTDFVRLLNRLIFLFSEREWVT